MIVKHLIAEFEHEVISTRKLLLSIPEKDVSYRPAPICWTMGELAQHIATIYYWYVGTLTQDAYDLAADKVDRGAPDDIAATVALFERHVELARAALAGLTDERLKDLWTIPAGHRQYRSRPIRTHV